VKRLLPVAISLILLSPLLALAQPAELMRRPQNFERSRDYDALHYNLKFIFDEAAKSYLGENTVTLSSLKDDLRVCVLDAEDLAVSLVVDAQGKALPHAAGGGKLEVTLPRPASYGEEFSFTVRFSHSNPKTGLKFIEGTTDFPPQVNTYSWPEDARRWFPCFDSPNDKASSEVTATVRAGWKVLSNGKLVDVVEDKAAGTTTWHWLQAEPHPTYCIMLAAGPFEVIEDSLGTIPVNYWVYKKDVADAPRSFRKTPRMIEFFSKTLGFAYPWAKYDQICVAGSGGGMEATTATILGHSTIHDERADQDFSSEGLVAHELAHMWWGDLVTERSWTDVWLSESFATYSEYLWTRHDLGEDEGALNLEDKKSSYLEEARTDYIRPIVFNRFNQPGEVMDGHSYPKGATVLHMLRFVMGDAAFFRTLSKFLERFAFVSADTHDFMTTVKDVTGENLDWFFEQWLMKPGHPIFDVSWSWDGAAKKVRLKVRQVQDLDKNIPVYRTPVLIGLHDGERSAVEKVWIDEKEELFEFAAARKPFSVEFDRGHYLLKELIFEKPAEELVFELGRGDAVGRIRAARELAKRLDDPSARTALEEAARTDGFWAVRRAAVESLAKADVAGPPAFFKDRATDGSSRVRASAVEALGNTNDRDLVPFFKALFPKETSYVVQGEILSAIGKCGQNGDLPFLIKAAALKSPRGLLKRNADAAMKKIEEASKKK
jgi:aminopeptidase N